ncbi:unnamed protein product [Didymodactylos carnosus]|uniref:Small ribosomal subunit protein eS7 n=2 Tax=Didymodactylos carnosus TaxID=1234261 RepID=A0A814SIT4_9BILA|nr:unnamed protein product [Didymodactylos carnosus]CAF3912407.1 unnamed protein product [Didymodactylos carnosus]
MSSSSSSPERPHSSRRRGSRSPIQSRPHVISPSNDREGGQRVNYTSICVKNIHPRIAHDELRKRIEEKFSKYGPNTIKIYYKNDERMVFVNYTNYHDAKHARHAKTGLVWDNWKLILEPVYYRRNCSAEAPLFVDYATMPSTGGSTKELAPLKHRRDHSSMSPPSSYQHHEKHNSNNNNNSSSYSSLSNDPLYAKIKRDNEKLKSKLQDLKQEKETLNNQLISANRSLARKDHTIAKLRKIIEEKKTSIERLEQSRDNVSIASNEGAHSPPPREKRSTQMSDGEDDNSSLSPVKKVQKLSPDYDHNHDQQQTTIHDVLANATSAVANVSPEHILLDFLEEDAKRQFLELENNAHFKGQLRELYITGAKKLDLGDGRSAIIIYIPVPKIKNFQRVHQSLVSELEKKLNQTVVLLGQRRILPKPTRKSKTQSKQKRPRNRTLTAVHDAILHDLVYPAEITGKRIRIKLDGSRLFKVHLDKNQQTLVETKIGTFQSVYKKLTGKDVHFEFPDVLV